MTVSTRRVALVTGAGRGIGRASAIALAASGSPVVVAARSTDELDAVVAEIAAAGGESVALECDLADRAQSTTLLDRAAAAFGPIDVLVNNAGIGSSADPRPLAEFRDAFWDETLELNLTAPYLLSKAALPHMRGQRWGRIVTVASINGRDPVALLGRVRREQARRDRVDAGARARARGRGDHGQLRLPRPRADARERRPHRVRRATAGTRRSRNYEQGLTPIGGRLEPEDIAPMVAYLASDAARMITGQAYNVDGGVNMA